MNRGAWWVTVHAVAKGWKWLKWLSSSRTLSGSYPGSSVTPSCTSLPDQCSCNTFIMSLPCAMTDKRFRASQCATPPFNLLVWVLRTFVSVICFHCIYAKFSLLFLNTFSWFSTNYVPASLQLYKWIRLHPFYFHSYESLNLNAIHSLPTNSIHLVWRHWPNLFLKSHNIKPEIQNLLETCF